MRVRGLKPSNLLIYGSYYTSHPMRVRGLKPSLAYVVTGSLKSHPMRVRGLKLRLRKNTVLSCHVAPHAGAWIETKIRRKINDK